MPLNIDPEIRFYKYISEPDKNGCINWIGNRDKLGYGRIVVNKKLQLVHRFAFKMYYGNYPINNACHTCDNPSCVNPYHLFDGTHQDNVNDKIKKGRALSGNHKGERNGRAKLTLELVRQIRNEKENTKVTGKSLAIKYGVGETQMSRILKNQLWVEGIIKNNDDYVDTEEIA